MKNNSYTTVVLPVALQIQAKADAFFKTNDRFPKWVFVGIGAYRQFIQHLIADKRFVNHMTLDTVLGEREAVSGNGFGVASIIPLASLPNDAIGGMESLNK